jgi:hypothetical protein
MNPQPRTHNTTSPRACVLLVAVALLSLPLTTCAQPGTASPEQPKHPRLLLTVDDLPRLRTKIQSGVAASAYQLLKARADLFLRLPTDPYPTSKAYTGRMLQDQIWTLALTGLLSEDTRYTSKAVEVLCAAAEQLSTADFIAFNDHLAVGDAALAYALAYDWLYPSMTPAQRELVAAEIADFGAWLFAESPRPRTVGSGVPIGALVRNRLAHNHSAVVHGGLALCAMALGGHDDWLSYALPRVRGYFENTVDDTGAPYEGLGYLWYGLHSTIPAALAYCDLSGVDLLKGLRGVFQVPRYLLGQLLPSARRFVPTNQTAPSLAPSGSMLYLLARQHDLVGYWAWLSLMNPADFTTRDPGLGTGLAAELPFVILWSDPGLVAQDPISAHLPLSQRFERGEVSIRDGWGEGDSLVAVNCGEGMTGIWDHPDEGTFSFYARGEEFVVDTEAHLYDSLCHNTLVIDGQGQPFGGPGNCTQGRITAFEDRGDSAFVLADATRAYRHDPADPAHSLHHFHRSFLFVRAPQPYLVIADDAAMEDQAPHQFQWRLHTASRWGERNDLVIDEAPGRARILGKNHGAACEVYAFSPQPLTLSVGRTPKYDMPYLAGSTTAANPHFVVVLCALDKGETAPTVTLQQTETGGQLHLLFADGRADEIAIAPDSLRLSTTTRP